MPWYNLKKVHELIADKFIENNSTIIFSFKDFMNSSKQSGYVAGTIMSIQEKKSIKGTPFAIIKLFIYLHIKYLLKIMKNTRFVIAFIT